MLCDAETAVGLIVFGVGCLAVLAALATWNRGK